MELRSRVLQAVAILLAVAVAARVAYALLAPLLPGLLVTLMLLAILGWLIRRH